MIRVLFRQIIRTPGFAAVAVLTLALGIGANTIVYSVARTVLLRPLGFQGEDRLVWIQMENTQTGVHEDRLSWREMEDIREGARTFETVGTFGSPGVIWENGDQRDEVPSLRVTVDLDDALGLRPALGRLFLPSDVVGDASLVALISYELWQSQFGGRADVLGQTVSLDKKARTIVGVLPAGLKFPLERTPALGTGSLVRANQQWFWLPMAEPRGQDATSRRARMFLGVGRLKPDVTAESARAELAALGGRLAVDHPESNRNWTFTLVSFRDQILGRTRQGIPLLAAAVAAVLAICCVNLANLLLTRGLARGREYAVRAALGASRASLAGALLVESGVLSLLGGCAGLAFAGAGLHVVRELAAGSVPFIGEARLDGTAVLFTAGLSVLTPLVFGLIPALRHSQADAADALRAGARSTGGPQIRSWQRNLLVGQIAAVLVLLASAAVLLESFRRLIGQDLGYQPQSVVAMDLKTTVSFDTNGDVARMYRALREQLAALPGVDAVGTVSSAPLTGKWTFNERPQVVGQFVPEAERPSLEATFVAFDYFQAMGIPLREGRYFRDSEMNDNGYGQIVVINESAATVLFPGRSAIGGRFTVGSNPDRQLEVIGVVKDTRDVRLEDRPRPRFYWQYPFGGAQVVVRGRLPATALMPMLRATIEKDPRVRVESIMPMTEIVASTVTERRFLMLMVAAYAGLALSIAAVGIFGVVGYQVAQRRNEFGVRLALGATPHGLLRLVLVQAGRLTLIGLVAGLVVFLGANRLLASQLFGLSPYDPILLGGVCAVLLAVSLAASFIPARRAASVDPVEALRHE